MAELTSWSPGSPNPLDAGTTAWTHVFRARFWRRRLGRPAGRPVLHRPVLQRLVLHRLVVTDEWLTARCRAGAERVSFLWYRSHVTVALDPVGGYLVVETPQSTERCCLSRLSRSDVRWLDTVLRES